MAYTVPDFNLTAAIWISPSNARSDPPDFPAVPAQLYRYSRNFSAGRTNTTLIRIPVAFANIPMPQLTSVFSNPIVECPFGSGAFYSVNQGLWYHRGFPNEYIAMNCEPILLNASGTSWAICNSDSDLL